LVGRWAGGDEACRSAVGDGLVQLASTDYDNAMYEDTYPLMCLESALSEDANRRLSNRFAEHAGTRAALEANIVQFLSPNDGELLSRFGRREGNGRRVARQSRALSKG
jgi:hypothetical protein